VNHIGETIARDAEIQQTLAESDGQGVLKIVGDATGFSNLTYKVALMAVQKWPSAPEHVPEKERDKPKAVMPAAERCGWMLKYA